MGCERHARYRCFSPKLKKLDDIPLIQSPYVKQLPLNFFKVFCNIMQIFPLAKRTQRLLRYEYKLD